MLRYKGCRAISVRHVSTGDDFIYSSRIIFLIPFLATMEVVALLANDLIMSGTSLRLFIHLKHQNPSIISKDIGRAKSVQQFQRRRNGGTEEHSCLVWEDRMTYENMRYENIMYENMRYEIWDMRIWDLRYIPWWATIRPLSCGVDIWNIRQKNKPKRCHMTQI